MSPQEQKFLKMDCALQSLQDSPTGYFYGIRETRPQCPFLSFWGNRLEINSPVLSGRVPNTLPILDQEAVTLVWLSYFYLLRSLEAGHPLKPEI